MQWSRLFIPTLREEPAGASAGERRLIRAGYARPSCRLFLGRRSIAKLESMVREEMKLAGAQEMSFAHPFHASILAIARHDLRSYKQFPQTWFEIEDACHRACSFEFAPAETLLPAYRRILDRCGINYIATRDELLVLSPDGDQLVTRGSTYEANLRHARSIAKPPVAPDPEGSLTPEEFHTPGKKTISDVTAFTGLPETSQLKTLVMVGDGAPYLILLRGDHTLNELKFTTRLGIGDARPATPDEIRKWFGADPGSLGPVGITTMRILADETLRGRRNMICGANRNDYHLRNVTAGKDFRPNFFDLRMAVEGDLSLSDGTPLRFERAFTLATLDDRTPNNLHVANESGQEVTPHLSAFELFLERILIAAAEQQCDTDGLTLAPSLAPFGVVITPVNFRDAEQQSAAMALHAALEAATLDPLLDDRDERPGVKFKDADLIGIPFRITIGKKLAQGMVEIIDRRTRQSHDVALDQATTFLSEKISL